MSDNVLRVDYVDVIVNNKKYIAVATLACALAALAGYFILPKSYVSGLALEVGIISFASTQPSSVDVVTEPIEPVEVVRDSIMSAPFSAMVIGKLGLDTNPDKLSKKIKARINEDIRGQEINRQVLVTTEANGPAQAKELADTVAELVVSKHTLLFEQAIKNRKEYIGTLQAQIAETSGEIQKLRKMLTDVVTKGSPNTASLVLLQANLQDKEHRLTELRRELSQNQLLVGSSVKSANTRVSVPSYLPYGPKMSLAIYIIAGLLVGFLLSTGYYTVKASVKMHGSS